MPSSKYHLPPEEVRRIRRSLGETQAEFAKRLCVDAVTVARWETDQRKCTGLYAKTIAELDKKNSLLIKGRAEMEDKQEPLRSIELHEIIGLTHDLKLIFKFTYKEVPLEYRPKTLETYQRLFEQGVYNFNKLFDGVCNIQLFDGIANFCIIGLSKDKFFDSLDATDYQKEKLSNSYDAICKIAEELSPNISIDSFPNKDIGRMFFRIKYELDQLLKQPNLKEGDIALLKFFRNLVGFTLDERDKGKFLPIPADVSFSFARFLSVCLDQPTRILVPQFDDRSQLESLRKYLEIT